VSFLCSAYWRQLFGEFYRSKSLSATTRLICRQTDEGDITLGRLGEFDGHDSLRVE
jgi:hypothetical protein